MDKQQIAHILDDEITNLDKTLSRLYIIYNQTTDDSTAMDLKIVINSLINRKQNLEQIITQIVEDHRLYNSNLPFNK